MPMLLERWERDRMSFCDCFGETLQLNGRIMKNRGTSLASDRPGLIFYPLKYSGACIPSKRAHHKHKNQPELCTPSSCSAPTNEPRTPWTRAWLIRIPLPSYLPIHTYLLGTRVVMVIDLKAFPIGKETHPNPQWMYATTAFN